MGDPRGHIEYLVVGELPWEPRLDRDGLSGWRVRELSRDRDSDGAALVAQVAPCWRRGWGYHAGSAQEFLVLRGTLAFGDRLLGPGGYGCFPEGTFVPPMTSPGGCEFYFTNDGPVIGVSTHQGSEPDAVYIDTLQVDWRTPPAYEGRPLEDTVGGMTYKVLRAGGPDEPYTYLVKCEGGWADLREESHETWEELFLLDGDYLMGDFGRICAGSYIFRPGQVPHGPQATATGSLFLARGEKLINFCFRPIKDADRMVADYFKASATLPVPRRFIEWS